MKNEKLTAEQTKRTIRNRSAKQVTELFKEQYKRLVSFPELTDKDIDRLREKLDACADSWLSDIVNEK